ncbi:ABC transporter ATP-binding protein [Mangrovibrevibacter kandeliae]|uniref:ABC transporter ATP-binding protein n=1 Tax=Mangrovibrevibacter kandeliae TaxID=2968473 RepID=UPI0021191508|nr:MULTISPECIES: ABC transporter ATP-binding protein [unclassified Aurantimonas]MCQ8780777.1 ABC transporter ATP-binding protein [Aurantimonas sp. CSK15Z-1]MCW4113560.1 ABC transporter ATP-binding protein [Aurantimonas sp. MSK8Z-1]
MAAAPPKSLGNIRRSFEPWSDPAAKPLIEVDRVTKSFAGFKAVDDLSLAIHPREFHALLGPSGCGKSTLLRMLAGFETPTAGDIRLDGRSLTGVPPHRRPVNMMFQSYALFPHMSVEKNIAFGLKQDGMARSEIADRVAEMLKLVKLGPFAKRKPQQLSGGQQQRVALARSLAKRPKVLLLDEPLGALDKKLREETQFELMDLQQELGLTFVVVTHDQEEAMVMADRISVMRDGRIQQVATPAVIYEAPATRYVADFIGNVNILDGTVESVADGRVRIATDAGAVEVEGANGVRSADPVAFAIRPEKMRISRTPPERADVNALRGEIWDIAYLGDVTLYNVKLATGNVLRSTVINAHRGIADPLTWDETVWLSFPSDAGIVLTA